MGVFLLYRELYNEKADFIKQVQREGYDQVCERVRRYESARRDGADYGVSAVCAEGFVAYYSELCEKENYYGKLEYYAEREDDTGYIGYEFVEGVVEFDEAAAEALEELKRVGDDVERERAAQKKEESAGDNNREYVPFFFFLEAWSHEQPYLPDKDRAGYGDAEDQGDFEAHHERVYGSEYYYFDFIFAAGHGHYYFEGFEADEPCAGCCEGYGGEHHYEASAQFLKMVDYGHALFFRRLFHSKADYHSEKSMSNKRSNALINKIFVLFKGRWI